LVHAVARLNTGTSHRLKLACLESLNRLSDSSARPGVDLDAAGIQGLKCVGSEVSRNDSLHSLVRNGLGRHDACSLARHGSLVRNCLELHGVHVYDNEVGTPPEARIRHGVKIVSRRAYCDFHIADPPDVRRMVALR
jgi:hypothetical protein